MRAMADTTPDTDRKASRAISAPMRWFRKIVAERWRVQLLFAVAFLGPLGLRIHAIPGCVFHCYACPLATFACPVGVAAKFASLHMIPLMVLGVVVAAGAFAGSLVCGWACPFGFLQDIFDRVPTRKIRLPNWLGYGRYVVLIVAVGVVPYLWGADNYLYICRFCPAGAIEAGLPMTLRGAAGGEVAATMSAAKWGILIVFVLSAVFIYRPWCRVFCPLGGVLALFNRVSIFHLRFDRIACTRCNLCRSRCPMGQAVDISANTAGCIRCGECTACGAIVPDMGRLRKRPDVHADALPSGREKADRTS